MTQQSRDEGGMTMSEEMKKAVEAMQAAVDEILERKAKLGYKVVIGDRHGNPKWVSAKYLVRKRRAAIAAARKTAPGTTSPQPGGDLT